MPEGDTVYLTATNLNAALAGSVLTGCDLRVPAYATIDLTGDTFHEVVPRGKHLLMHIGDATVHSHLKMEGSWHLYHPGTKWKRPTWQARAVLSTEHWVAVGFDLGELEVVARKDEEALVGYLGPDPLSDDWDEGEALRRMLAVPGRPVGLALLDQRVIAGLGNVYRNELCFLRGVLPTRPVGEVAEPEKLVQLGQRLIHANRNRANRTTTGKLRGDTAWVHDREGEACFRCGTPIRRGTLGENELQERNTFYCEVCQA